MTLEPPRIDLDDYTWTFESVPRFGELPVLGNFQSTVFRPTSEGEYLVKVVMNSGGVLTEARCGVKVVSDGELLVAARIKQKEHLIAFKATPKKGRPEPE